MMSDTTDTNGAEIPASTVQQFLNAARDSYVDTTETRFHDDGAARIVLTHTHQGAFRSAARTARRFGLIADGSNTDAAGQQFQHLSGTTPTLRVAYDPDAFNVVMVKDGEVLNPPLATGLDLADALDRVQRKRDDEKSREDVEFRVQHAATQDLREDGDDEGGEDSEVRADGGENPKEISADDLPDSVTVLREKVAACLNMALDGHVADVALVEAASIGGLKYEKVADIARDMGLNVDAMNADGLGVADSDDDIERREPEGWREQFCDDCDGMTRMNYWTGERGGVSITSVECQRCGGEGAIFHMAPTADRTGILLDSEDEDERLKDLRERGVHPQVSEREE